MSHPQEDSSIILNKETKTQPTNLTLKHLDARTNPTSVIDQPCNFSHSTSGCFQPSGLESNQWLFPWWEGNIVGQVTDLPLTSIIECSLYMWNDFKMKENWLVLDPPHLQFSRLVAVMEHPVTVCMQWIRQFQFKLNCYSKFVALWFRWTELCDFVSATVYFVNQWEASLCDLSHLRRRGVACLCIWKKSGGKQVW